MTASQAFFVSFEGVVSCGTSWVPVKRLGLNVEAVTTCATAWSFEVMTQSVAGMLHPLCADSTYYAFITHRRPIHFWSHAFKAGAAAADAACDARTTAASEASADDAAPGPTTAAGASRTTPSAAITQSTSATWTASEPRNRRATIQLRWGPSSTFPCESRKRTGSWHAAAGYVSDVSPTGTSRRTDDGGVSSYDAREPFPTDAAQPTASRASQTICGGQGFQPHAAKSAARGWRQYDADGTSARSSAAATGEDGGAIHPRVVPQFLWFHDGVLCAILSLLSRAWSAGSC